MDENIELREAWKEHAEKIAKLNGGDVIRHVLQDVEPGLVKCQSTIRLKRPSKKFFFMGKPKNG